ncbi:MAG TPA: OmpH family outer membrane protein [Spirochaetia bacterium]|nr:OmpH family outer membrane protein [Spirochaetia bacterium]
MKRRLINSKRLFLLFIIFSMVATGLFAQKLSMVAIVDLRKITTDYFKESAAFREIDEMTKRYEEKRAQKLEEIDQLKVKKIDALNRGNETEALRIDAQISEQQAFLQELYKVTSDQINKKKDNLLTSSGLSAEIVQAIQYVAESEGYSVVLRQNDASLLYYNMDVDITDKVLQYLRTKKIN